MSAELDVKTVNIDSNSLYRTQRIKFSSVKTLTTPTKSIPLDILNLRLHTLNPKSIKLNEIFKRLNAEQIKEANENSTKYQQLENWFNAGTNKIKDGTVTFCFLDFDEKRVPTTEEIEFMTTLAYCNSDITTIPTISHFNMIKQSEITYDSYKNYLNSAIGIIEQLNKKPIMGVIPKVAPKQIEDLFDFYQKKGINSFSLDLAGSNPIRASLRIFRILKTLNKMKLLDQTYLHGHNVGMRVNKIADVIPAKDILGFGLGLNSLGEKHTKFTPNRSFIEYVKTNPQNKFRLFDKENYGYWKDVSTTQLSQMWPNDSGLNMQMFRSPTRATNLKLQKIFNAEQLALESHHLGAILNEETDKSLGYVKNKKYIDGDDIKLIEKGKDKIKR